MKDENTTGIRESKYIMKFNTKALLPLLCAQIILFSPHVAAKTIKKQPDQMINHLKKSVSFMRKGNAAQSIDELTKAAVLHAGDLNLVVNQMADDLRTGNIADEWTACFCPGLVYAATNNGFVVQLGHVDITPNCEIDVAPSSSSEDERVFIFSTQKNVDRGDFIFCGITRHDADVSLQFADGKQNYNKCGDLKVIYYQDTSHRAPMLSE